MQPASSKLQPAVFGGLFIGVLSALPLINFANCCCLWVIGGGVLAAYLLQQNHPYPITAADGALVGLLAGMMGGALGVLLSIPIEMAMGPMTQQLLERLVLSNPDFPEESKQVLRNMANRGALGVIVILTRLVFSIVVGAVFAMLGGLLGVALFKKKDVPPGTSEILPPA